MKNLKTPVISNNSQEIDRIAPTMRPDQPLAGMQRWRNLLFLHWPVPRKSLRDMVPDALELDVFDNQVWVGLVPFRMHNIRPRWLPSAMALNFLECNLRTYVIHNGRPGVYFFSLDASSRLAVWAARLGWSLPYFHAQMSETMPDGHIRYQVDRNSQAKLDVSYRITKELGPSKPGSMEHFFLERYLLFTERRGRILCGQVHHTPYPTYEVEITALQDSLISAAGLPCPEGPPALAHWSFGVDVEVFSLKPVD